MLAARLAARRPRAGGGGAVAGGLHGEGRPALRVVGAAPGGRLAPRLVHGDGGMDTLMGVNTNRDHGVSFPVLVPALLPRGQGSLGSRLEQAPIRSRRGSNVRGR